MIAAGLRPCSGAILVLVFSAAQGIVLAGVVATLAMALGTALTTGAIAVAAVYAKDVARRFSEKKALSANRFLRAALGVLLLGLGLVSGALVGVT